MRALPDIQDGLATALLGKTRTAILALLYGHPDESFYGRQVADAVGSRSPGTIHRELGRLVEIGLVACSRRGRNIQYQANGRCPIAGELSALLRKTAGLADVIRAALAPLRDRVRTAFIYGSQATGRVKASSDVDVMIVGTATFRDVVVALGPAQQQLGREVNPTVYSMAEFRRRIRQREHFVTQVLEQPRVLLIGTEDELKRLGR